MATYTSQNSFPHHSGQFQVLSSHREIQAALSMTKYTLKVVFRGVGCYRATIRLTFIGHGLCPMYWANFSLFLRQDLATLPRWSVSTSCLVNTLGVCLHASTSVSLLILTATMPMRYEVFIEGKVTSRGTNQRPFWDRLIGPLCLPIY